jgi:hypothetical protein
VAGEASNPSVPVQWLRATSRHGRETPSKEDLYVEASAVIACIFGTVSVRLRNKMNLV